MNSQQDMYAELRLFGLKLDEAKVYVELLKGASTHQTLSQATSVNRTKVYRIVQDLEQRGLVAKQTDDRGSFLIATDPDLLESSVVIQEQRAMEQRGALQHILPALHALQSPDSNRFITRTYDGLEGLKQMCWHELKARGVLLTFGSGTIEQLIPNHYWAEKQRALSVKANYKVYEIINDTVDDTITFTENEEYMSHFEYRVLPTITQKLARQTVIYNDTVAIYSYEREDYKSGVEIINEGYAQMMRGIFWHYWGLAVPPKA